MSRSFRLAAIVEYLRGSLWFLPTVSVLVAVSAAASLGRVDLAPDSFLGKLVFGGGPAGARGMLQAVAGSVITVTSLVFSLTVVALQLAASQFSPRLLRTFLRDVSNQVVLSVFLATFAYCLTLLRYIRASEGDTAAFVPHLGVTVGFLLALASLAALVFFIQHITQSIRIEALMREVEHDTLAIIERVHPDDAGADGEQVALEDVPESAVEITAQDAGILTAVSTGGVGDFATRHDLVVRYAHQVGDFIVAGSTLAWAWARRSDGASDADPAALLGTQPLSSDLRDEVAERLRESVAIGFERTLQQDVAFGLQQLVDVVSRALSPGVNDPTTAVDALGYLTSLVVTLSGRDLRPLVEEGPAGVERVVLPRPTYADYLALACDAPRHYGADQPRVLVRLLWLLGEAGRAAPPSRSAAVMHEIDRVVTTAQRSLQDPLDLRTVFDAAERARVLVQA